MTEQKEPLCKDKDPKRWLRKEAVAAHFSPSTIAIMEKRMELNTSNTPEMAAEKALKEGYKAVFKQMYEKGLEKGRKFWPEMCKRFNIEIDPSQIIMEAFSHEVQWGLDPEDAFLQVLWLNFDNGVPSEISKWAKDLIDERHIRKHYGDEFYEEILKRRAKGER
jgi:hypothetical protein